MCRKGINGPDTLLYNVTDSHAHKSRARGGWGANELYDGQLLKAVREEDGASH